MGQHTALPLYIQVSEWLIREVSAGRLLAGERLPPERAMAAAHGIAVGTLRKALAELERKGMLERRHGSGNYLKAKPDVDSVYAFFRVELLEGGGLPTARLLSLDRMAKPDDLPRFGASAEAFRIRRLRSLNKQPVVLEEIWLDADGVGDFTVSMVSESLYLTYRERFGIWIARAEDKVGLAPVPDWTVGDFQPQTGETCLCVERTSWDRNGRSVEVSRSWIDPARARYVARIR